MIFTSQQTPNRGFTLLEMMTALVITTVVLLMMFSITNSVLKTWNKTDNKLRNNVEGRVALDLFSTDLQSAIIRNRTGEWLRIETETIDIEDDSVDTSRLMFFTPAPDRELPPGDICAVSYRIAYQDGITGDNTEYNVPALYRALQRPEETYRDAQESEDLLAYWDGLAEEENSVAPRNFLSNNVIGFKVRAWFQREDETEFSSSEIETLSIHDGNLEMTPENDYQLNELRFLDVSLSILTREGFHLIGKLPLREISKKYAYHYTRRIQIPQGGSWLE